MDRTLPGDAVLSSSIGFSCSFFILFPGDWGMAVVSAFVYPAVWLFVDWAWKSRRGSG